MQRDGFLDRHGWKLAVGLVVFGLLLRLGELDAWTNPDEGINYSILSHPTLRGCWIELVSNTHPPLLSVALWVMSCISLEPIWLRMLSLACGLIAIFGVYLAGRELAPEPSRGPLVGLVAAFLVACSPAAIEQSQTIRPYTMQLALLALATWGLARWLREGRGLAVFSAGTALAVATVYNSIVPTVALGAVLVSSVAKRAASPGALFALVPPAVVASVLFFSHIEPYLLDNPIQQNAKATWLAPYLITDVGTMWRSVLGVHTYAFGSYFGGPLCLLSLASIVYGVLRRSTAAVLCALILGIATAASAVGQLPLGNSRHSIYLLVFLALVAGQGVEALSRLHRSRKRVWLPTFVAACASILAGGAIGDLLGRSSLPQGFPAEHPVDAAHGQEIAARLATLEQEDSVVVLDQQTYFTTFAHHLRHWNAYPRQTEFGLAFESGKCRFVVHRDWTMTLQSKRLADTAHLYTFLQELAQSHPEYALGSRPFLHLLFGGWYISIVPDLISAHETFESRLIRSSRGDARLFLAALDLPYFMKLFAEIRRQFAARSGGK